MCVDQASVASLVEEYRGYVEVCRNVDAEEGIDWQLLAAQLIASGDWTSAGAEAVVTLVRIYGAFVLRNALALAIAAGIEDGEAGL